ncbi:protein of unknown function [Chitinophaga costaii]|uniref:DUF4843 domain-containing protein n=1 Tax=Chitinophaga costaii TaxID=1335309 RepID=A0A1C4AUN9_9BACT|nr:DUF4843 domain-containing protein [Chitinophaga costaii]PUZ26754.1 DUF4843 domain-containing protein [Chitinophaga costaii]SCB98390.1 protein of unknown function [Chitinophaga costaii]
MKKILVLLLFLTACSKIDISTSYKGQESVYFIYNINDVYSGGIDSITYTFVDKASTVTQDTVWLPVRIAGNTTTYDRAIKLAVVANQTTALPNTQYKLLDYNMPGNAFATRLGVVLLRDASLQDTSATLTLGLQPSADFPVLMKDTLMGDGAFYNRNQVRIIFNDRLIKPGNWDTYLVIFFGTYSETKLRFIASVLGVSTFPSSGPNALGYPTLQYYQNTVRNALLEYNANHAALTDENGNPVVIP